MPLDQPSSASHKLGHDVRMTFGEHIEDLRRRLILALVGVVVAGIVTLTPWVTLRIIEWITQPFTQVLDAAGLPPQTYVRGPTLVFGIYVKVGFIAGIIVASPWVLYQLWRFVVDGLYPHERRAAHLLAPLSTAMTLLAVLFTRYILLPASLMFFATFATMFPEVEPGEQEFMVRLLTPSRQTTPGESARVEGDADASAGVLPRLPVLPADPVSPREGEVWINGPEGRLKASVHGHIRELSLASSRMVEVLPDLREYIAFATLVGLGNVLAFQLPVVMLVVGWTRLFDPAILARGRKYAFFACAVAAALITPADVMSMLFLLVPLYGLFELGLLLMRWAYRRAPAGMPDGEE